MAYTGEQLTRILMKTNRKCHICRKTLARRNHGLIGRRGAWHVDHSVPRAVGGTDHENNLYAACIRCNCAKQHGHTTAARALHGFQRAPLSAPKASNARVENGLAWGTVAFLGAGILGATPIGLFVCALFGAWAGHRTNVDPH